MLLIFELDLVSEKVFIIGDLKTANILSVIMTVMMAEYGLPMKLMLRIDLNLFTLFHQSLNINIINIFL
jgi:hypothetical protein